MGQKIKLNKNFGRTWNWIYQNSFEHCIIWMELRFSKFLKSRHMAKTTFILVLSNYFLTNLITVLRFQYTKIFANKCNLKSFKEIFYLEKWILERMKGFKVTSLVLMTKKVSIFFTIISKFVFLAYIMLVMNMKFKH